MQKERINLIIFDLDGTLLNTLQDLADSVNYAMESVGLPTYTSEQVRMMIGNGVEKLVERAVTSKHMDKYDTALKLQREYYLSHNKCHTMPYESVNAMLSSLKQNGVKVGVFSNKDAPAVERLCKDYFGELVGYSLGTTVGGKKKPDPFGVNSIMALAGELPANTIYCGDSEVDIATANNAGIGCISATWGYRDKLFLEQNGGTIFADSPLDVANYVLQFNK